MGGEVLGVFTAGVAVVVFDQVFKDGGVEVEFLRKNTLKAELHQFVDDGAAEGIAFWVVSNVLADAVEQYYFCAAIGFYREYIVIGDGDIDKGIVKQFGKVRRVLLANR